jgi:hypothetical protein
MERIAASVFEARGPLVAVVATWVLVVGPIGATRPA